MTTRASRFQPQTKDQDQTPPRCLVCGSYAAAVACEAVEPGFKVLRCNDCGFGRTWPAPPPSEIGKWYPQSYYGDGNVRFNPLFEKLVRLFRKRRARVFHNRVARGPVLDVGCGRGLMLSYLRELGYEPHGVEFSEQSAYHAREVLKLPMTTEDFSSSPHEHDRYNAIIFWHSFEHFFNPIGALQRAHEALKPGGLLAIAVPNYDSWQARLFGRYWFHLDVPRHYTHFGLRSLEQLLHRHRFRVVQADHFSFEQNPYGILQSLYNALGFRFNLLYSLLKTSSARTETALQYPVQTLLIVALLPVFLPLSLVLCAAEAVLHSGGTIEVYALKE